MLCGYVRKKIITVGVTALEIWEILGVAETTDLESIKNAYRNKLLVTNPEDDPEGFKKLRAAYEEAVKKAKEKVAKEASDEDDDAVDEAEEELTEERFLNPENGGDFRRCVERIYKSFYRRIDEAEWKRLINTEFAQSLDTSEEALNIILSFFMGNIFLPQHIFKVLVSGFSIDKRRAELEQRFPRDYIEYFINNSIYPDVVDYRLFEGPEDADYDGYISRFADLDQALKSSDIEKQDELIAELSSSLIRNPLIEAAICRNLSQKKQFDEALSRVIKLSDEYPDNQGILVCWGDILMAMERYEEAHQIFDRVLMVEPNSLIARIRHAEIFIKEGKYEDAKDILMDLAHTRPYDNYIRGLIQKCNQLIVETNLEKIKELSDEKELHKLKIQTAWAYYQSFAAADAVELLGSFEPFPEEEIEYNNLLGRSYLLTNEYLKARKCFLIWMDRLMSGEITDEKQLRRKPYVNYLIGATYFIEKDYITAEKYIDISLQTEHEEIIVSKEMKCEILYETKRYNECINECEAVLRGETNFIAQLYIAKSYFRLGSFQVALDESNKVKSIYPYSIAPYKLEMDIFMSVEQYDDVLKVIAVYEKMNKDSQCCRMMRCSVAMNRDKEYTESLKTLEDIDISSPTSDIEDKGEYYFLLARCLEENRRLDEAEENFRKLLEVNEYDVEGHRALGRVYRKKLKFAEAVEEYSKQIEISPRDTDYIFRAITYKVLGKYTEAAADYEVVLQLSNPAPYINTLAAENLLMLNRYREAADLFEKGLAGAETPMDRKRAWKGLASALALSEEYDRAFAEYERMIVDFGVISDIVFPYEELLAARGRFGEAEALVSKLLYGSQKVDEQVYTRLCRMKCRAGDIKGAEAIYKRAGDEGVNLRALAYYLGHAYLSLKDYAKAEKFFLKGMENSEYTAYSELAEAAAGQFGGKTRFRRYKDLFEKYKTINEYNTETLVDAARIARVEKDPDKAEQLLLEALKGQRCKHCVQSACGEAYKELVKVYLMKKQKDKAREALKQARRYMFYDFWLEQTAAELGL